MAGMKFEHDRSGIALVLVLFVMLIVGAVATSAALLGSNAWLINVYDERQSVLEVAADAGLEEARARINGDGSLYPDSGYITLESGVQVEDARGQVVPGVRRYTYVGPTGSTTGQYGVFGSVVAIAEEANGDRVIRRADVTQESFAKFAYFTDFEPSNIAFGSGDQIFGPVHSNDGIRIYSSGATFHGPVTTGGTVTGRQYGNFRQGLTERAPTIPMPETADLDRLRTYAQQAGMAFMGSAGGAQDEATLRIEFLAIDLNGDGDTTDSNEGFIRVYESADARWVVAGLPDDYGSRGMEDSRNCGHYHSGTFVAAIDHPNQHNWIASLTDHGRCYPGGSDSIFGGFVAADAVGPGAWRSWPHAVHPAVAATGRADAAYLFPISRDLNPEFRGVIFVDGKVAISGVVRGHVTLAATDNIVIIDDLVYATDPGSSLRDCTDQDAANDDIAGLFSGTRIIVADNTINTPTRPRTTGQPGSNYITFDDTPDEIVHATLLALDQFTVQDYGSEPSNAEWCGSTRRGRGCLFLTGGIIQRTRGAVGQTNGTGYLKRYSYDTCVVASPPPYFPTTGYFVGGRYFEIDPVGFDVAAYYELLSSS